MKRETETTECRSCGASFNLAAQFYYDNLCPSCKREADDSDEDVTKPVCPVCDERYESGTGVYVSKPKRGGRYDTFYVCSDECKTEARRRQP